VLALHGADRAALFDQVPAHDLILTSYALLRRDAEHYRRLDFDTVVLDEAQHIKNRQTQNAQAVKTIRAAHKLVLTGTPMENSVLDLWSIFDFLMPGYLGAEQDFRERYEIPITRERNAAAQTRLARRLRPFVLRRAKRDVAADLPEKIEQISYCDLGEEQRMYYQQVLEAGRREIIDAVNASGLARSRMLVLTTLLRLRQICCDVRLLKTGETGQSPPPSGKVELFHELIEETLDGGHRALVFSQFTTMLQLLRQSLAAQNVTCCYLDGATKDRAAVVEKFQTDRTVPVFLISLKAGGTGLNLTGADTVIHFDPWWNPAVEAQAIDRAHRIGQRNVVTSYKLIARGTVEEKILSLQARKQAVTQAVLGGEEPFANALSWEEIRELIN
jgi:SNF2 family DNA or RNA helicase